MSFIKKMFGIPDKPKGTTQVYEISKDIIFRYMSEIVVLPAFAQMKSNHPNIPDNHLAVLMYAASDTVRAMPDAGENAAVELAGKSCIAYDQGRLMVTETSLSYHLLARTV